MLAEVSRADDRGIVADKDMEEDALSSSSVIAGVTASTASGSHDAGEVAALGDASEAPQEAASASAPRRNSAREKKHTLEHTWCFWALLYNSSNKDNWQNSQMNIQAFSTVEEFWRLFNNIRSPSRLGIIDFSIFKKDIAPAWEDETCRQGGRWIAKIDKMRPQDFDELWLNMCLSIIGENFGEAGYCVCGAVVSTRAKNNKMALWISEREEEKALLIGREFHKILQEAGVGGDITFWDFSKDSKEAALTFPCDRVLKEEARSAQKDAVASVTA